MKPAYVPKSAHETAMQRALIQYRNPQNYDLVKEALWKAGREDLIGFDKKCLIAPRKMKDKKATVKQTNRKPIKQASQKSDKYGKKQKQRRR